jgi:hypothetical protein
MTCWSSRNASSWKDEVKEVELYTSIVLRLEGRKIIQHVVEEDRSVDGHHQALLKLPSDRRESTADGTIR